LNVSLARYWFAVRDGKNSSPVKKFIINRVPRGSNPRVGNRWIMVKPGGLPGPCEPGVLPGTVRAVLAKPGVECSPDLPRVAASERERTHKFRVKVCVECLIGKQKKPILFKVTEPSSIPYRTHSACANFQVGRIPCGFLRLCSESSLCHCHPSRP